MSQQRFQTAFLHIGLGKTGTTSIQKALLENARKLESEHDLHFPCEFDDPRPFGGNHSIFIASLFGERPEEIKANIHAGYNTADTLNSANIRVQRALEEGFRRSSASRVLISAEHAGLLNSARLGQLRDWLLQYAQEIVVIACVRHPLSALSSQIQQRLKTGRVLEELYAQPHFLPLKFLFNRLENTFGREAIRAYDYAQALRAGGGLVGAFLGQLGIQAELSAAEETIANRSMSHEAALLLSALNRQRPLTVGNHLGEGRSANDVEFFRRLPGRKFQAPAEVYSRVREESAPHLAWLAEHYGLELEEPVLPEPSPYYEFSPEVVDRLGELVAELAVLRANVRD